MKKLKLPLEIPKKMLDKRIPTLVGMGVLVVALIAGTLLIGQGGGVFSPRASADTTPKKIKVTNVQDTSFSVSFLTDSKVAGFVKYSTDANSLKSQAGDDRDQISGTVGSFQTHHITIRGLQQNEIYYYVIGTGSGSIFNDNGKPFEIKTTSRNGAPAAAKTIYGSVTNQAGAPAEGSIVYIDVNGAGTMSSQIKASGSWAIPLSNARTNDGSTYAVITDDHKVNITVQGPLSSQTASFTTTVRESQPVAGITFGQKLATNTQTNQQDELEVNLEVNDEINNQELATDDVADETLSEREIVLEELTEEKIVSDEASDEATIVELTELDLSTITENEHPIITTENPVITGKAPPGVTVSIVVNSDTQIEQDIIVDENGDFILDIAKLSESLEPGEHTASYSYTDPDTGEIIEKTIEFTVDPTDDVTSQLALADDIAEDDETVVPYGSGNPYPIGGEATESAEASDSAEATEEARTSQPSTEEGVPVSGSVGTTLALVFGGLFFIISGLWSLWISTQLEKGELKV
jgi:hypothetical protein